jgi:uncharacterized peroxidase-related enzyme
MSNIKIIQPVEAEGRLKEIYDGLLKTRGQIAEVHKIQSLRPESILKHMDFYMEIMYSKSELSRANREMMAVVVSVANLCEYCRAHHAAALNNYWQDEDKIQKLVSYQWGFLTNEQQALCQFAKETTLHPSQHDGVKLLKTFSLSDEAILDATLVVSYFNFVNRMVLTLGVKLEADKGENYNY